MIWFFQAAHNIMRDYDRPDDHDGPRHFEYGLALMAGKLLEMTADKRGMASAEKAADYMISRIEDWKRYRHVKASCSSCVDG